MLLLYNCIEEYSSILLSLWMDSFPIYIITVLLFSTYHPQIAVFVVIWKLIGIKHLIVLFSNILYPIV